MPSLPAVELVSPPIALESKSGPTFSVSASTAKREDGTPVVGDAAMAALAAMWAAIFQQQVLPTPELPTGRAGLSISASGPTDAAAVEAGDAGALEAAADAASIGSGVKTLASLLGGSASGKFEIVSKSLPQPAGAASADSKATPSVDEGQPEASAIDTASLLSALFASTPVGGPVVNPDPAAGKESGEKPQATAAALNALPAPSVAEAPAQLGEVGAEVTPRAAAGVDITAALPAEAATPPPEAPVASVSLHAQPQGPTTLAPRIEGHKPKSERGIESVGRGRRERSDAQPVVAGAVAIDEPLISPFQSVVTLRKQWMEHVPVTVAPAGGTARPQDDLVAEREPQAAAKPQQELSSFVEGPVTEPKPEELPEAVAEPATEPSTPGVEPVRVNSEAVVTPNVVNNSSGMVRETWNTTPQPRSLAVSEPVTPPAAPKPAPARAPEPPPSQPTTSFGTRESKTISIRIPLSEPGWSSGSSVRHIDLVFQQKNQDLTLQFHSPSSDIQRSIEESMPSLMDKLRTENWGARPQEAQSGLAASEPVVEGRRRTETVLSLTTPAELHREPINVAQSSSHGFSFDEQSSGRNGSQQQQQGRNRKREQAFQNEFDEQQQS